MRVDIIFTIDAESYKRHADEQEGTAFEVARNLKAALLNKVRDLDVRNMAEAILRGDECIISSTLRDPYADLDIDELADAEAYDDEEDADEQPD